MPVITGLELSYFLILGALVVTAAAAVHMPGDLTAVIILSVFSVLSTVVFALLQAVDVAMAEAVIGAGFMTALFVTAIGKTRRSAGGKR